MNRGPAAAAPAASERIARGDDRGAAGMRREDLSRTRDHLVLRDAALSDRFEIEENVEMIVAVGAREVREMVHAFDPSQFLHDSRRNLGRSLERRALRRVHVNREFTHVAPDETVQREHERENQRRDADDRHRMVERPPQRRAVHAIDPAEDAALLRFVVALGIGELQEPRAEHRRQREADDHRDQNRERHRPAEGVNEPARVPGHERHRHENDDQRQCRRHHRQRHFARALNGSVEGRALFFLDVSEDVFQHHNRVVDHDPHGERQAEERHVVEREVHGAHQCKRRDDRGRDGQRRDDDGPDVPDEEHDDRGRQEAAPQQVLFEGRDRRVNEPGIVAADRQVHALRQPGPDRGELCLDRVGDLDGVFAGGPPDVELNRRAVVVHEERRRHSLNCVLGVAHVGNPHRRAVDGRDDDVVELVGRVDASERTQTDFPFSLLDRAAWDFDVFFLNRVAHLVD